MYKFISIIILFLIIGCNYPNINEVPTSKKLDVTYDEIRKIELLKDEIDKIENESKSE